MDKRKSQRVQFFQLSSEKDIRPVWVFSRTNSEAVLGLVLDLAPDGLQVLTNNSQSLAGETFTMRVHSTEKIDGGELMANVKLCWSQPEGTLYTRNGFTFDGEFSMEAMLVAHDMNPDWLRCELLPR
jgi:hypothetical protein